MMTFFLPDRTGGRSCLELPRRSVPLWFPGRKPQTGSCQAGRCLGDTLQDRLNGNGRQIGLASIHPCRLKLFVDLHDLVALPWCLAAAGCCQRRRLHLPQYLAHDNLDVLIVDINTHQTVYLLYFADDIICTACTPWNVQDVAREDTALCQAVTLLGLRLTSSTGS